MSVHDAQSFTKVDPQFQADVIAGLRLRPQRAIPAQWFYDRRGSQLFEEITRLDEYYVTRTEVALLERHCGEIGDLVGRGRAVVEFGAGSLSKTPILFGCVQPAAYVPIDISGEFLREAAAKLAAAFPKLTILPLEADFNNVLQTPDPVSDLAKLGFFPGSTIGNMGAFSAVALLRAMRETLGVGAMLLIGMDRVKREETLVRAYDDRWGVTAAFNLNLLDRINRELNGTIPVEAFRHVVRWNAWDSRIEMHLEACENVSFVVQGHDFAMAAGETIHTENSHKYELDGAKLLLRAGGWTPVRQWTDPDAAFALILAEAQPAPIAP